MSLTTNILAYWKLDESSGNATDATGGGATMVNNGTAGYASGIINNGIDLGASNITKWLSKSGDFSINGGAASLAFWIKLVTDVSVSITNQTFMCIQSLGSSSHTVLQISYEYNSGTPRLVYSRKTPGTGGGDRDINNTVTMGTSSWYYLVLTYDATTLTGYLNGSSIGTIGAVTTGTITQSDVTQIGMRGDLDVLNASATTSGIIDEVGIWSRALTGAEVTSLYNGGVGLQYPFIATVNSGFFQFM